MTPARWFTLFYTLSSLAEGAQTVVLLWLTYALTGNAVLVGLMVVLGYLPAAVVGLLFRRLADSGRARTMVAGTNVVLAVTSALLFVQQLVAGQAVGLTVVVIGAAQVVLSLAKMINKAALGRLVRGLFGRAQGKRVLEVSSSGSLIGQVAGAGVAGVLLATSWLVAGLLLAVVGYLASALAMAAAGRGHVERATAPADDPEPRTAIRWTGALVSVLVFSVPSSGALQFLNTLQVPLADAVAPHQPAYYAVLNVVSVLGGFLAGILLSTNVITAGRVLSFALPVTAALAMGLTVIENAYVVAAVMFLITLTVTMHVVCMQVLTNQTPRDAELGQFTVVRNVVASLAKACFSFAAGALMARYGLSATAIVLAVTMAVFSLASFAARVASVPEGADVAAR